MSFDIFKSIFTKMDGNRKKIGRREISVGELQTLAQEAAVRELAFDACVNMIARYVGSCEFQTFMENKRIKSTEYYLWNIEPNVNQNKTMFLHKLIRNLYLNNEALIIETGGKDGGFVVADSWEPSEQFAVKQNTYTGVTVGDTQYKKTFYERDIIHIKLSANPVKPVIDALYSSYYTLVDAAMNNFTWNSGKHWKVHVDSMMEGREDFQKDFSEMIEKRIKPFLTSHAAVLPEFDGYTFSDVGESRTTRSSTGESADIRGLIEDIFDFTAQGFGIPPVLVKGKVENTSDAKIRFYTLCDTIIRQLEQEINRKRFGFEEWKKGNYIRIESSNTEHFSLLDNSANLEKLIGSAVYSVNDILEAIGGTTIDEPWADAHFLTKNIGELSTSGALLTS